MCVCVCVCVCVCIYIFTHEVKFHVNELPLNSLKLSENPKYLLCNE